MLNTYHCIACAYQVQVGSYHYHSFTSGYFGACELVCNACGASHTLQTAARFEAPEFFRLFEVTVVRIAASGRLKFVSWLSRYKQIPLSEALAMARQLPLVVSTGTWRRPDEHIRSELEALGAELSLREIDKAANPDYRPMLQADALSLLDLSAPGRERQWRTVPVEFGTPQHDLPCQNCGLVGKLVMTFEPDCQCPWCKHVPMKVIDTMIT